MPLLARGSGEETAWRSLPGGGDAAATSPTGPGIYVVVDHVDAHHERAKAAGARRYRVLDPEGYEWSFGTYSRPA